MRTRNPFAAIALSLVSACAAGPDYTPPSMDVSSEYAHVHAGTFDALEFDTEWWLILNDPLLDTLIRQAMRENHDLRIARANVAASRAFLREGRFERYPIVTAQAQLELIRATIPPLESEATTAMHRLAVLTGREPATLLDELGAAASLPVLPQRLPVGDPAILLRRRPDVAAAERRLAAATARIGVATADLFPRVSLTGSAGYLSTA